MSGNICPSPVWEVRLMVMTLRMSMVKMMRVIAMPMTMWMVKR